MTKLFTPLKLFKNTLLLLCLLCSVFAGAQELKRASVPNEIKAVLELTATGKVSGSFYINKNELEQLKKGNAVIKVTLPEEAFKNNKTYSYKGDTVSGKPYSFTILGTAVSGLKKDTNVDIAITSSDTQSNSSITFIYDETGTAPAPANNTPAAGATAKATTKKGCHKTGWKTCGGDTSCNTCHEMPTVIYTIDACLPGCKAVCSNMDRRHKGMIVRQNEFVAMRIKNLNPFRYNYTLNNTEIALNLDDQASFQNAIKNSGLANGALTSSSAPTTDPTTNKNASEINNKKEQASKDSVDISQTDKSNEMGKKSLQTSKSKLESSITDISKETIDSGVKKINQANALASMYYNAFEDQIKILQTQTCIDASTTNSFLLNAQKQIDSIIAQYGLPDTLTARIKMFKDTFLINITNATDKKTYTDKLTAAQTVVDSNYKKTLTNFQKEVNKYSAISLELTTFPYQPKAKNIDLIEYDFAITDNNTKKTNTYTYNVFVRNGFKVDFSTGIFITGLKDKTFTTQDSVLSDTATVKAGAAKKKILAQNTGPLDFMVGALVNLTWRTSEMFSVGASFGLAFSTQTKFQFIFGPALTFGKFYRVSLHAGMALGKVTDLDAAYQVNKYYNLTSGSVPTTDKFGYSWFAGVTYNFLKLQKDKAATTP